MGNNWKNAYGTIGSDGQSTGARMTPRQHKRWRQKTRRMAVAVSSPAPATSKPRRFRFFRRRSVA